MASVRSADRKADSVRDNKDVLLFGFLVDGDARRHRAAATAAAEMDILSVVRFFFFFLNVSSKSAGARQGQLFIPEQRQQLSVCLQIRVFIAHQPPHANRVRARPSAAAEHFPNF